MENSKLKCDGVGSIFHSLLLVRDALLEYLKQVQSNEAVPTPGMSVHETTHE